MNLSVCGICRNEALELPEFLECVEQFADEIVIGDTGSTDESMILCHEHPKVHLLKLDWQDHFARARNQTLEAAKGRYILVLDMDERLRTGDGLRLVERLKKADAAGFFLPIYNLKERQWKEGSSLLYEQNTLRCFLNRDSIRFEGRIHEIICESSLKGPIEHLDIPILHLGYAGQNLKLKEERNRRLICLDYEQDPKDPHKAYLAGLAWMPDAKGVALLKQNLEKLEDGDRYRALWALIAEDVDRQQCIAKIRKMKSDSFIAAFVLGNEAFENQELERARAEYELACKGARTETYLPGESFRTVLDRLAVLQAMQGNLGSAGAHLEEIESRFGMEPELFHQMLKVYTAAADRNKAFALVKRMPQDLSGLSATKRQEVVQYLKILTGRSG